MVKVYDVTEIREKLKTNDKWLVRGILAIYARQTADEKSSLTTKHHNNVGFNGRDAGILSSFAKQILSWQATENPRYPQPLSSKQFAYARRAMPKYAGQLVRIAEENNPVEDEVQEPDDRIERERAFDARLDREDGADLVQAEIAAERDAIVAVEQEGELTW